MQWFTDLPIGRKLALGFGALATLVLLVGGIGVGVSRAINTRTNETFATHALPALQLKEANVRLLAISRAVRNAILDADAATIRRRQDEIRQADSAFRADFGAYRARIVRREQQVVAAQVMSQFDALRPQQDEIVALALAGNDDAARNRLPGIRLVADSIESNLDVLAASKIELMHAAMAAASRSAATGITTTGLVLLAALAAAIALGLAISRQVSRGLTRLGDVATAAARGDVDVAIDIRSRDEVGQLADRLRTLMSAQRDMASAAQALSRGDLTVSVTPRSERDVLSHAFVALRDTTKALVTDVTHFADGARQGNLTARGNAAAYAGAYATLVTTLNGLLDAVEAPLTETATVLGRIADRDLSARMTGQYAGEFARIAASVNQAADALDLAIGDVGDAAAQVASAGGQIASGSQSLAEGTSRQSASLEEIGSSVEEMSAMTVQTAANLKQARQMSDAARQRVEEGRRAMDALSTAIAEIRRSSDDTAKVAKTIEEIAFQTNLLALNAAVEAARAGDAGRGFSVVAEEVRALATRSAEAAKTSSSLIDGAIEQSRRGVTLQQEVLGRLAAIDQDVTRVTALVGEIAGAGEQQQAGITQINQAVEQLNGVTQGAAANAEESAAAAQQLAAQAMSLNELVGRFTTSAQSREGRLRSATAAPRGHAATPPLRPVTRRRQAANLAAW